MFDVLPPGGGQAGDSDHREGARSPRRARRRPASVSSRRKANPQVAGGSRVVQVEWKLPARLRKPVREQLEKERQQKRRRRSIIQFDRKPIHTRPVTRSSPPQQRTVDGGISLPRHRLFNRGAEHHTGDVYRSTKAQLQIAAPPYVGNLSAKASGARPPKKQAKPAPRASDVTLKRSKAPALKRRRRPTHSAPVARQQTPRASYGKASASDWFSERDISYDFTKTNARKEPSKGLFVEVDDEREVAIKKPKSVFSLPFSVSFWPRKPEGDVPVRASDKIRKKKFSSTAFNGKSSNLVILVAGCALAGLVVWNLQGLGRASMVLSAVQSKSQEALDHVFSAQAALAEADVAASETSFKQADVLIREAQSELDNALAAQGAILRVVDVTGTVRSGQELLEVGSALAAAGQHISRGLNPLLSVDSLFASGDAEDVGGRTVADGITESRKDFELALVELEKANESLEHIGSPLLPAEVQEHVQTLKQTVPKATELVRTFVDQSDMFLHLLGAEHDRQYLLLFANNHELRPIGGFIGTIGLVNVDSGRVENIDIQSVYDPDGQLREYIAPPNPLLSIVDRWYMRDANWFVDYEVSAPKIAGFFEKEGGPTVDGVILFTPHVIQRLLEVTGPITVPGYDVEVSADNFFEVTQREVTYQYDRELNRPKQFLADLTPILLNKLFESRDGANANVAVMNAMAEAIYQKDLLLYFRDAAAQEQIRKLNWSGTLPEEAQGFLYVNNANIGGHKSDQFVEQEIDYRTQVKADGDVEVTVTVRRTHNGPTEVPEDAVFPEGENPAYKDNIVYQRTFVPRGAQLLEATGFTALSDVPKVVIPESDLPLVGDDDVTRWQAGQKVNHTGTAIGVESEYTFFANWVITKPGQTSVTLYRYTIPRHASMPSFFNQAQRYSVYVAKQPGDVRTSLRASIRIPDDVVMTHVAPETGLTRESDQQLIYRGGLVSDIGVGAVLERS